MNQDHNPKKPTKKQAIQGVANHVDKTLKENFIKNMVMGGNIAYQSIIEYINKGHTLDEVLNFCKMNVEHKDVIENVAKNQKEKGEN